MKTALAMLKAVITVLTGTEDSCGTTALQRAFGNCLWSWDSKTFTVVEVINKEGHKHGVVYNARDYHFKDSTPEEVWNGLIKEYVRGWNRTCGILPIPVMYSEQYYVVKNDESRALGAFDSGRGLFADWNGQRFDIRKVVVRGMDRENQEVWRKECNFSTAMKSALLGSREIWEPMVKANPKVGRHFLEKFGHLLVPKYDYGYDWSSINTVFDQIGHVVRFNGHIAVIKFGRLGMTGTKVSITYKGAGCPKWTYKSFQVGDALNSSKWTDNFGDIESWLRTQCYSLDHFRYICRFVFDRLF